MASSLSCTRSIQGLTRVQNPSSSLISLPARTLRTRPAHPSTAASSSASLGARLVCQRTALLCGSGRGQLSQSGLEKQLPAPSFRGKGPPRCACVAGASEVAIASALFSLATAAVIPLYTLMLLAPDRPLTKRVISSSIPWLVLGFLYVYLLGLSWTPVTLPSMFSSKYWLPELPSITRMFSSTLTVASAWIHLLALDLFAARSIYLEGLRAHIETRHSLCLCLLFAPVGILCHAITKALTLQLRSERNGGETGQFSEASFTPDL